MGDTKVWKGKLGCKQNLHVDCMLVWGLTQQLHFMCSSGGLSKMWNELTAAGSMALYGFL